MNFVERVGVILMIPSAVTAAIYAWVALYRLARAEGGDIVGVIVAVLVGPETAAFVCAAVVSLFFCLGWVATGKNYFK